ncbi:MAG: type I-E CRISPR-associated protein Cas5/CasD [Candidatus Marinimicrobia bacterium]|nr:type I-E CRISPR-associated protein Cas5/CasD [Candidatus Neomarinimicrobiota bacterium]
MYRYLAIKLQGVMQAWGGHTYEDLRHIELIPTRSGILGLLAASIGIDRRDVAGLEALSASVALAVRMDSNPCRIMDFHTVLEARKVDGKSNKNPVVSRREYLCDAVYTLLAWEKVDASINMDIIGTAVQKPTYTPFLGRRSCPIGRPLFAGYIIASDLLDAFEHVEPIGGLIYSDERLSENDALWSLRDEPVYAHKRQFASRILFIHSPAKEDENVSQ